MLIQNQFVTRRLIQANKPEATVSGSDQRRAYAVEKSSRLTLRLKLFTQVAAPRLKCKSSQIFDALTQNAL